MRVLYAYVVMDKKLKICIITNFYPPIKNGVATFVKRIAKNLASVGHEIYVFTAGNNSATDVFKESVEDGVRVYRTVPALIVTFGDQYHLSAQLHSVAETIKSIHKKIGFDLINGQFLIPSGFLAVQLGKDLNLPVVVTTHGSDIETYRFNSFFEPAIKEIFTSADIVTTLNAEMSNHVKNVFPDTNVLLMRHAVDPTMFSGNSLASLTKSSLKVRFVAQIVKFLKANGYFMFGTMGIIRYQKGFDILIDAFAEFKKKVKKSAIIIIGDYSDSEAPALKKIVSRAKLATSVFPTGFISVEHTQSWLRELDVFLFPSRSEGLPCAVSEAMLAGLPIVASDISGINDLIVSGQNGLLVPAGSPSELLKVMFEIYNDNELRRKISVGATYYAKKELSPEKEIAAWQEVYEQAIFQKS